MPPRYAFWTILIDDRPTAFRARDREELLPTVHQLRRTNANVVLKWFARGRLWATPEEARAAERAPKVPAPPRGPGWRPGGVHADPRDRFRKRAKRPKPRASAPAGEGERPRWSRPKSANAGPTRRPGSQSRPVTSSRPNAGPKSRHRK